MKGGGERHPVHRDARQPRQDVPHRPLRAAPQEAGTAVLGGARLRSHAASQETSLVPSAYVFQVFRVVQHYFITEKEFNLTR